MVSDCTRSCCCCCCCCCCCWRWWWRCLLWLELDKLIANTLSHVCTHGVVQETASANNGLSGLLSNLMTMTFLIVLWVCNHWHRWTPMTNASGSYKKRWSTSNSWNLHCWNLQSPISQISKDEILKPQLSHQQIIAPSSKKNLPLGLGLRAFSLLWATWIGINWWCQMLVFTRVLVSPVPLLPIVSAPWFMLKGTSRRLLGVWCSKWDKLIAFQQLNRFQRVSNYFHLLDAASEVSFEAMSSD